MNLKGRLLITGGTSGLGLELVRLFLDNGFEVIATGRRMIEIPEYKDRFSLYRVDFADLAGTSEVFRQISKVYDPDYVIYNAGILSPPDFTLTKDGFEYTFQVNFLAHYVANEIIIHNRFSEKPLLSATVTSMAYRAAEPDFKLFIEPTEYRPWKAYSDSKYYLSLMSRYYSEKYPEKCIRHISFDPGIFGSELYRTQQGLFRMIYKTGIRIMKKPDFSARILSEILMNGEIRNGAVYDTRKKIRMLSEPAADLGNKFWSAVLEKTSEFIA